ncbi:DUF5696 domain-containing protein [Paenibacillus sp. y28]|uniref:DUF5696 domain-containing protein n=1 Tax=Paenibacillus sp. y28 TaxID=3129110 RepID=UPI0030179800
MRTRSTRRRWLIAVPLLLTAAVSVTPLLQQPERLALAAASSAPDAVRPAGGEAAPVSAGGAAPGTAAGAGEAGPSGGAEPEKASGASDGTAAAAGGAAPGTAPAAAPGTAGSVSADKAKQELPADSSFRQVAASAQLELWFDRQSGHFQVRDHRSGGVWRSYPNPADWAKETMSGTWRNNLRSPVMLEYIDMDNFKSQPKIISFAEDKGTVESFEARPGGFRAVYHFTASRINIPVEVKLTDDYLDVRLLQEAMTEEKLRVLNVKLFPMLGAEMSGGQDGYLLVPDGSGALIRFKPNRTNDKTIYREDVYGADSSFYGERTGRQEVKMPVFGIKSGNQGLIGVITGGEEYAKVFASPGGAYGQSNWATAEWQLRTKFYQRTSKKKETGFYTYNKEPFQADRSVRYYFLDEGHSDYVGMAAKYREYLMREHQLKPLQPGAGGKLPMFIDIIGADRKKGLLWDTYLKGTTTSEAMEMVKRLYGLGIENMSVQYLGYQKNGYSSFGGLLPVDERLGGNNGMKQFIDFAHSLNIPVYLGANYTINNNDRDGFRAKYEGLRNLAGTLQQFTAYSSGEQVTMVSPRFYQQVIQEDLAEIEALGADGVYFEDGIGRYLDSDFNDRYPSTRRETKQIQQEILSEVKHTLGGVRGDKINFFGLGSVNHIQRMPDDYSYDLFMDEAVPFAQIAVHGLITYTSDWINMRDQYRRDFLRAIEYGFYPSFTFTSSPQQEMKGAYWIWYYSMNYRDWEAKAVEEYQRYNEALGDVQNKFIVNHRAIEPNVMETVYEGGKRVIVNYNQQPVQVEGVTVQAQDFVALPGGGKLE